jgi:hypothetical protein
VLGGSLAALVGDTRGGDFGFARFDVQHTSERGLIAGFSLFRSDAAYFCRDPDMGTYRPPFVSLLGPCTRGEWIGIGGSLGEGFHDGGTGRTALRPISAYAVLNPLGNGQSPSYERVRLLVRGGGAVEHVWTELEGGVTVPRVGGGVVLLARTMGSRLEARGTVDCGVDPAVPQDTAFQSSAALRWNFLLGGTATEGPVDGVDPWGVASIGLAGGYSYWGRPLHAFPDITTPFVSDERTGTWQLLLTGTLGFEGLSF